MSKTINDTAVNIREGISVFTACMNRGGNLEKALRSWLAFPDIQEIIIVDWSSDESLTPLVKKYQDGRIVLAIVRDQKKWILTHAFNLAARLTTHDKIFKIDADVEILPGFFEKHVLRPGIFFTGNWANQRNENEQYLNGMIYLYRDDFFRVNGYNEYIQMYGWDDDDLYGRLQNQGLRRGDISNDTLHHIGHEHRTFHQDATRDIFSLPDSERAIIQILMNRFISQEMEPWSVKRTMRDFRIEKQMDNLVTCYPLEYESRLIPPELWEVSRIVAVRDRLNQLGFSILPEIFFGTADSDLEKIYHFYMDKVQGDTLKTVLQTIENRLQSGREETETFKQLLKSAEDEVLSTRLALEAEQEKSLNLDKQVDELHRSYSWRIGHGLIRIVAVPVQFFSGLIHKMGGKSND